MKYKRVLMKLSGEAMSGAGSVLDYAKVDEIAATLAKLNRQGLQMGIVIGGGNIFRGRSSGEMNRSDADHMGMLATAINAIALKDAISRLGVKACVMSALEIYQICEMFSQREAKRRVDEGEIVIFACGTGCPYFSTDTAAALRALEIGAQILLCGKNIDGVYSADPKKVASAVKYSELSYDEVISKNLQALDAAAFAMCRDNSLPIFVFALTTQNIEKAVYGEVSGTHIGEFGR